MGVTPPTPAATVWQKTKLFPFFSREGFPYLMYKENIANPNQQTNSINISLVWEVLPTIRHSVQIGQAEKQGLTNSNSGSECRALGPGSAGRVC